MDARILKTTMLSKDRMLTVDSDWDVFIRDEVHHNKKAFFTGKRFAKFLLSLNDINRFVGKARDGKDVTVKLHLGGGWHLSLSPGFACVDIRKFYQHSDKSIRPTKMGIALTYDEWDALMNAAATINNELDGFKAISICWHDSHEELEKCSECAPYTPPKEAVPKD